jgi:hypothetical protein
MNLSFMNIFCFLFYKKTFFLYNDYITKPKKLKCMYNYTPYNNYNINKIMNK